MTADQAFKCSSERSLKRLLNRFLKGFLNGFLNKTIFLGQR